MAPNLALGLPYGSHLNHLAGTAAAPHPITLLQQQHQTVTQTQMAPFGQAQPNTNPWTHTGPQGGATLQQQPTQPHPGLDQDALLRNPLTQSVAKALQPGTSLQDCNNTLTSILLTNYLTSQYQNTAGAATSHTDRVSDLTKYQILGYCSLTWEEQDQLPQIWKDLWAARSESDRKLIIQQFFAQLSLQSFKLRTTLP